MEPVYSTVNAIGRTLLFALGVHVRVHGLGHLPRTGPVILASTHGSYLDFVVLEKAAVQRGRYVRFMARHDAWVRPVVSAAMDRMGHIPVDRANPAAAALSARRRLLHGHAVGIFAEAGISFSFTVRALMPGVAGLARATGVPVVPVAIWGAQRITTVGDPTPKPDLSRGRVVDIVFGAPMFAAPDADLTTWTRQLGATLTELLESLQRLPHHQPRPGEHAPWYPAHLGGDAPDRTGALALDDVPRAAVSPTWGPSGVATGSLGLVAGNR